MNYKQNKRYFEQTNMTVFLVLMAIFLVTAVTTSILGFSVFKHLQILGITGLVVSGLGALLLIVSLVVKKFRRPTDRQIDDVYQTLADTSAERALKRVGLAGELQLEIKPVVLCTCIFEDIHTRYKIARGRDKKMRSSNFASFVLLFTLEQIITYRSRYSIIREEWEEIVEEYYYDDIVTLATKTKVYSLSDNALGEAVIDREELSITTSAGTVLELPFENNDVAAEAILHIRKIIRVKKRFK